MNETITIQIKPGETCGIDSQTQGLIITGPATVVVIKQKDSGSENTEPRKGKC